MEPPWMKEGLSVGLVVGMSGGGEGMLGGRLGLLNVTRTPSAILWTSWFGAGWRTGGNTKDKNNKNNIWGLNKQWRIKNFFQTKITKQIKAAHTVTCLRNVFCLPEITTSPYTRAPLSFLFHQWYTIKYWASFWQTLLVLSTDDHTCPQLQVTLSQVCQS